MIDLVELQRHEGRRIELHFTDGYVVRVRLIGVDADSPGTELIYQVEAVIDWGPLDPKKVKMNAAHAASAADVAQWTALE